jgi:Amidohydrolase family
MIASGIETGFGDDWIKFGANSEHTLDGSFSERTMALSFTYPGQNGYKGNVTESQEACNAWVERVHRAGIQVNCHANGDLAIDEYLTVRAGAEANSAIRRSAEDHALHARQRRSRSADQGGRRSARAVFDLRLLQHRQVSLLWRRVHEARDGVSHAAGRGGALHRGERFSIPVRSRRSWAFRGW